MQKTNRKPNEDIQRTIDSMAAEIVGQRRIINYSIKHIHSPEILRYIGQMTTGLGEDIDNILKKTEKNDD